MSDKRRPPSLHRGPAPVQESEPEPGYVRVVFHFDHGGDAEVTFPEAEIEAVRRSVGLAWNSPEGQMFTITDGSGRPSLLINLGKVRLVDIR